jgi:hypothetical protein
MKLGWHAVLGWSGPGHDLHRRPVRVKRLRKRERHAPHPTRPVLGLILDRCWRGSGPDPPDPRGDGCESWTDRSDPTDPGRERTVSLAGGMSAG